MIAKRIVSPKGGAGYQRLGAYVLNVREEHRGSDPASWGRLNAYILDAEHEGEKVAWARVTNCASEDPGWAVKEIIALQARNTRSQRDKNYHLVVSFPEGERPSREQLEDIEDQLVQAIGLEAHQRVSAVHQNTDNWHLHVAINTVHPQTLRNVAPFQDHFRLQEACADLELKHGLLRDNHTERRNGKDRANNRAQDFEARRGGQSFLAWVQKSAAPALLAARDSGQGWQGLHQAAAAHGLVLKLRGAGLVVGHAQDARLHVKASDVDRQLSLQSLTNKLGPFEPPSQEAELPPGASPYRKPEQTGALYEVFKQEQAAADAARKQAIEKLKAKHISYAMELTAFYRDRMKRERESGLRGALRWESFRHVNGQRVQDHAERRRRETAERQQARRAHPVANWQTWLESRAAAGDTEALKLLRSRQQRAARLEADVLGATDATAAKTIIHMHLHPAVRRSGAVIYRVKDGGMVADEATHIRVAQPTTAASFLALTLAVERFGTKPLVVRGSDSFRNQVAELAGLQGMGVSFADGSLEGRRQEAVKRRSSNLNLAKTRDAGSMPEIHTTESKKDRDGRER